MGYILFMVIQVGFRCKHQTPLYTSFCFPVDWLIAFSLISLCFMFQRVEVHGPTPLVSLFPPHQLCWLPIIPTWSEPLLDSREVTKLKAKTNVRVIMREISYLEREKEPWHPHGKCAGQLPGGSYFPGLVINGIFSFHMPPTHNCFNLSSNSTGPRQST